ncbi:MAG: DUF2190 family protein [Proteobacteria bacterium]|nr:DUF2190 family protein [Pseudomonadota bacterium]
MAGSPDVTNPYYDSRALAGDEVSSSGEGRIVNIQESELIHPAHTDGLVDKGDPVAFWDGVGVALRSALAVTDIIPIDTEGIWRLSVENTGLNNFGDISVGQVLFIDASGLVYDDWQTSFAIFGYALQPIDSVRTEVIAVKVHWMYPYWFYDPLDQ